MAYEINHSIYAVNNNNLFEIQIYSMFSLIVYLPLVYFSNMFVCPELIEETPVILACGDILGWLGQVRILDENSNLSRSYDVIVTFSKV